MNWSYSGGAIGILIVMLVVMPIWKAISSKRNERLGPPVAHVDVREGQGTVTVRRPHAGLQGAARSLNVVVDGVPRGKVKGGQAVAVALEPGHHSVNVTFGRRSSATLSFAITPGAAVVYETEIIPGVLSATIDLRPA